MSDTEENTVKAVQAKVLRAKTAKAVKSVKVVTTEEEPTGETTTESSAPVSVSFTDEELDAYADSIETDTSAPRRFCVQCGKNNTTQNIMCLSCAPNKKGCKLCKGELEDDWRTLCKQCFVFCSTIADITKGMIAKDIEMQTMTLPPRQCNKCYTDFIPERDFMRACKSCYSKRPRAN